MSGYELSKNWFDWCFENPEKINPNHSAMYFYIIDHCNRLGWKDKFGLPMQMTMEAIGISNYRTYAKTFLDLESWGFILVHQRSKNQYTSNIIAIVKNTKAKSKAHTKATHNQSQSIVGIDKLNNLKPQTIKLKFNFRNELFELIKDKVLVDDYIALRKLKRASCSQTVFNSIVAECSENNFDLKEAIKIAIEKNWVGFKVSWVRNLKKEDKKETFHSNRSN